MIEGAAQTEGGVTPTYSSVLGALTLSSPKTNESTSTHHNEHVSTVATVYDLAG